MEQRCKIIAVDFDGTLCENKWPEIGEEKWDVIEYLKKQQKNGAKLILWTCRTGELLEQAIYWCHCRALFFDAVNENLPEILEWMDGDSRKIFADEYIDDRNVLISSCHEKSDMEPELILTGISKKVLKDGMKSTRRNIWSGNLWMKNE